MPRKRHGRSRVNRSRAVWWRKALFAIGKGILLLGLFVWLLLLLFRFINPPTTAFMLQSPYPVQHQWVALSALPDHVSLAFVAAEDQRFVVHHGLDFTAISNAITEYDDGNGLRGASTITQQMAKNLLLWPGRNLFRKGVEAVLALMLDVTWGKRRILEVYLNSAEFGRGIYGIEAASQHYFGHGAYRLSVDESARLAVLLPAPRRRDPNHLSPYLLKRVQWIKRQMRQLGPGYLRPVLHPGAGAL